MKIIVQEQAGVNSEHLKAFVAKIYSKHEGLERNFLMSMNSKMNKGIFSIDDENGLAVVATTQQSTWHPHCIYVQLAYEFNRVNNGALQLMMDELEKKFEKPLFFLIDNRFKGLDEVLLNNGLRFIRKTEVIMIRPPKLVGLANDRKVTAISEITNDPILLTSLLELCERIYTETHLDNPVGDFPLTSWEDIIMEDLNLENSYVVINENKVIAFSFMYPADTYNWELGWLGVQDLAELTLLDEVIAIQVHDATKLGITAIEKEVDSTCPYSLHIVESLSYDVSETLYAFMSK